MELDTPRLKSLRMVIVTLSSAFSQLDRQNVRVTVACADGVELQPTRHCCGRPDRLTYNPQTSHKEEWHGAVTLQPDAARPISAFENV